MTEQLSSKFYFHLRRNNVILLLFLNALFMWFSQFSFSHIDFKSSDLSFLTKEWIIVASENQKKIVSVNLLTHKWNKNINKNIQYLIFAEAQLIYISSM